MYGLKQATILAYEHLKDNLGKHRYKPIVRKVGMWDHKKGGIKICALVNKFGIKYFNKSNTDHLLEAIGKYCKYTTNWEGNKYCGLTFN